MLGCFREKLEKLSLKIFCLIIVNSGSILKLIVLIPFHYRGNKTKLIYQFEIFWDLEDTPDTPKVSAL